MWKVAQKRNWVKLKFIQTLLRIICLADRKSYVVIISANAREKLTKSNTFFVSGKVGVCSNIAQNRLFSPLEVICDHYMSQFMSKVDQTRNWVKLKSVQTLLRIACLANRKLYVIIIYANACEKLTKSENVLSWSRFKYCSKVWKFYQKWNLFKYCSKSLP